MIKPYHKLNIIWVADYYDGPINGLCKQKNKLCSFDLIQSNSRNHYLYEVKELNTLEKINWLRRKWLFEFCVGTHSTYKKGKREQFYRMRNPKWFWKILYNLYYGKKLL